MWIRHLSLAHFRNYKRQELDLSKGITLLLGDNAQGKSNLLEAAFLLATTRSERATTDADLIDWAALTDAQPVARVAAQIERIDGPVEPGARRRPNKARAKQWTASSVCASRRAAPQRRYGQRLTASSHTTGDRSD
jgi:DNA replication and repair protein RecF